jgi:hypothetical protein
MSDKFLGSTSTIIDSHSQTIVEHNLNIFQRLHKYNF